MSFTLKPAVLRHLVDVHCHPTDAGDIPAQAMESLNITICAMSSMKSDQQRVARLAESYPDKVIPCFGYHPWFCHLISLDTTLAKEEHYRKLLVPAESDEHQEIFSQLLPLLPEPTPISEILSDLRSNLTRFPNAMVGEVGLDRIFRVPFDYFATERRLTPFTIPLEHQIGILEAQFELAIELGCNISIHSVKTQQATVELFHKLAKQHRENWLRISIDMHSCGFSPETWRDTEKAFPNVFLSLSMVINQKHSKLKRLITQASPGRLLVESDYNNVEMSTPQVLLILELVAEVKGWKIEDDWEDELKEAEWGAVRRLAENWKRFKEGNHPPAFGSKRVR